MSHTTSSRSHTLGRLLAAACLLVALLGFGAGSASASTACPTGYTPVGIKSLRLVSGKYESFATCAKKVAWKSNNSGFTVSVAPSRLPGGYCAVTTVLVYVKVGGFEYPSPYRTFWVRNCAGAGIQPASVGYDLTATDRSLGRTSISRVVANTRVMYMSSPVKTIGPTGSATLA